MNIIPITAISLLINASDIMGDEIVRLFNMRNCD